jgi:anti-anti-sigma factor
MSLLIRQPISKEPIVRLHADVLTGDSVREATRLVDALAGSRLNLDLSTVRIPTAGGLGGLLRLHNAVRARGGRLVLLNVQPWAFEVFAVTRLTEVLDVRAA